MKLFLKILAAILGLLLVALVAFVLLFDANMFKPHIEDAARQQNIALDMQGDMSWQLWPALAIEVEEVQAAALQTPDEPIMRVSRASLRLAIKPLFRGEVVVHHVLVDGAVVDLVVNEQGEGNWQALTQAKAPEADPATADEQPIDGQPPGEQPTDGQPAADDEQAELQLAVERISLRNSTINYTDHSNVPVSSNEKGEPLLLTLQDIELEIASFNLQGEPFTLDLQWQTLITDADRFGPEPVTITGSLHTGLQLAADFNTLDTSDGELLLRVEGHQRQADLKLTYALALRDMQDSLRYLGELELAPFNAKQLLAALGQEAPATQADYALTEVALAGNFTGSSDAVAFEPFTLTLDKTRLTGSVAVTDLATSALEVAVKGDEINVDDYLAPDQPEAAEAEAAATGDEELIPVETIRPLVAKASIDFARLVIAELPFEQVRVQVVADEGLVTLENASANMYGGTLTAKGSLDARGDTAVTEFEAAVQALQLAPLMRDLELDQNIELSGAVNTAAQLQTAGLTLNQLLAQAQGQLTFTGEQVRIAPLNVEEKFCEIVELVNQRDAGDRSWPPYTEMRQLAGKATLKDQVIRVEQFAAGVERLQMAVQGTIDLGAGNYNLTLPLTLTSSQTSGNGCRVKSEFWLDRKLSLLRCRGSLEGLDPVSDCRPDSKGLTTLVRDYGAYKVRAQHGEKIDAAEQRLDEKKDELRRKAEEKLGGQEAEQLEDKLKRLLRR